MFRLLSAFHRAGMIRPGLPSSDLFGSLLRMPFRPRSVATAVTLHATLHGDRIAVSDHLGDTTWRDLHLAANRMGNLLLRLQQESGSESRRVAILQRNGCPFVVSTVACARVGLDGAPMNTWARPEEITHILHTQKPFALLVDPWTAPLLEDLDPGIPCLLAGDPREDTPPFVQPLAPLLDSTSDDLPPTQEGGRVIMHTSGTTGLPKGAERNVDGDSLDTVVRFLGKVPLHRDDTFALASPMFHSLAWGMMAIGLVVGTRFVLRPRFRAEEFAETMTQTGTTALTVVPVMVRRLLDLPDGALPDSLRIVITSGAPMTLPMRDALRDRLGDVHYDLYGSTETGWATISTPEEMKERPGTVGRPGDDMVIRILDDEGNPLPAGETGRVFMGTGWEFDGYTGRENDRDRIGGLLTVGDVGHLDEDGFLYLTGRADDMIIRGGENIYPAEVETVLEKHPALRESAVIGVDDEEYGQALRAFVVPSSASDEDAPDRAATNEAAPDEAALRAWLHERIPDWKVPRDILFLDALPRNATGKILRRTLREMTPP